MKSIRYPGEKWQKVVCTEVRINVTEEGFKQSLDFSTRYKMYNVDEQVALKLFPEMNSVEEIATATNQPNVDTYICELEGGGIEVMRAML